MITIAEHRLCLIDLKSVRLKINLKSLEYVFFTWTIMFNFYFHHSLYALQTLCQFTLAIKLCKTKNRYLPAAAAAATRHKRTASFDAILETDETTSALHCIYIIKTVGRVALPRFRESCLNSWSVSNSMALRSIVTALTQWIHISITVSC